MVLKRAFDRFVDFYWGQEIAAQAPALAFYLVSSLVPLALGLAAIAGLVFGDVLAPERVTAELAEQFPPQVRDPIAHLAGAVRDDSPWLLVVSILVMTWTSSAAIGVIERIMNKAGGGKPFPAVWGKLRHLLLGILFAVLFCAAIALATLTTGLIPLSPTAIVALNTTGLLVGCTLIFLLVPRKRPRLSSAAIGALPATAAMQMMPLLAGIYFDIGARLNPGSIFFALAVVLTSCFIIAQGLLIGAGLAARRG